MTDGAANAETMDELGQGAQPVITIIQSYEETYQPWITRAKNIIQRYRDIRLGNAQQPLNPLVLRKFNILWSNVETLKPTLYARLPKMIVEREYKDKDPIGRIACEIAERAGNYTLRKTGFDFVMRQCVQDRLLPGRAIAWVDYQVEGDDEPVIDPLTGQQAIDPEGNPVTKFVKRSEKAVPVYVDWDDFGHSAVRTWDEVDYVWRKVYMDLEELKARFPRIYEEGKVIPLDRKPTNTKDKTNTVIPQATIYIVYCKAKNRIYWVHKEMEEYLDEREPAVKLEGFWPCPRPLYATLTNESLEPVPDFYYYQDQADLLDKIVNRMARIVDAFKVAGVYDKGTGALANMFHPNGAPDNILLPVDNWSSFLEKGGLKGAFQMADLSGLAQAYQALQAAADQVLSVIYQVTGISDIIRGASDPNETATAQGIKSQYASLRIKDTQQEVARFSRDLGAMIVEVIVENYEPKTIYEMVNAGSFCKEQEFVQALQLLRNQKLRDFRIDIETDSTIALDDQQQKMAASEFMQAVAQFFQQFGPLVQMYPQFAPMVSEMLTFLVRRFSAGRQLEGIIEQTMQQVAQAVSQPKPDPNAELEKAKLQLTAQEQQADTQDKQAGRQLEAQRVQSENQRREVENVVDLAGVALDRASASLGVQL